MSPLDRSICQNFGSSIFFAKTKFCAEPLRIQTAGPPRLQQVSHIRGVWKSVVLHKITGSDTVNPLNAKLNPFCHLLALLGGATIVVVSRLRVKPQKTVTNRLMFSTLPQQLTHHHQIALYAVQFMPLFICLISRMKPHKWQFAVCYTPLERQFSTQFHHRRECILACLQFNGLYDPCIFYCMLILVSLLSLPLHRASWY